jgi:archaellum component FlaG (FlaF/FlaG flagellin family)
MQVKTQKQVMVLQNKAQKVADKLNEEVIFITKGVQHIQVQAGTVFYFKNVYVVYGNPCTYCS